MIDDSISWKNHISYICSRISRNTGIISKLRHYLSINQLKQIYYNLIYPYISYAILAWGSAYKSHLQKVQIKQNHVIRLIFFATSYGKETESAKPLLNLLDILTVHNISSCMHLNLRTYGTKDYYQTFFKTFLNMPTLYITIILGMQPIKTYINQK